MKAFRRTAFNGGTKMSIFKKAFLYVTRKQGKTILLFAILLIMATFVLTGLSIWKAPEAAQLNLRQSPGGKFDVSVDWSNSPYVVKEPVKDEVDEEFTLGNAAVPFWGT